MKVAQRNPCQICAWRHPARNLKDVRKFGPSDSTICFESRILVHDFCWRRLLKHLDEPPDFHKLVDILQEIYTPRYKDECKRNPGSVSGIHIQERIQIQRFPRILRSRKELPRAQDSQLNFKFQTVSFPDCFQSLPLEIRFSIAQNLSTTDFLNLRLCSKAMAPLFESQQFWKTRFMLHGEQGYLSFLAEEGYNDWRLLNWYTHSKRSWPLRLDDLKTQWLMNEHIRDRYMMVEDTSYPLIDSCIQQEDSILDKDLYEDRVPTPCKMYNSSYRKFYHIQPRPLASFKFTTLHCGRCGQPGNTTKTHTITVSYPILKVAISLLIEGKCSYISGFDLVHGSEMPDTQFGYRIPKKQVIFDMHGQNLKGFDIVSDLIAIRAIRPVMESDGAVALSWVGDQRYYERGKPVRLCLNHEITAISGDFQDRKLVGFAVLGRSKSTFASSQ